jgi:hypothetical protein
MMQSHSGREWMRPFVGPFRGGSAITTISSSPIGESVGTMWNRTLGSPAAQAAMRTYRDNASAVVGTARNATLGLLAAGVATGDTTFHSFKIGPDMTPEQLQLAKLVGLPNGYQLQVATRTVPGAEDVGGRVMLFSAQAPFSVLPPGMPGQRGTAQPGIAPAQPDRLPRTLVFGTSAASGPNAIVGFRAGTDNLFVSEVSGLTLGSVAANLPIVRIGTSVKNGPVDPNTGSSPLSISQPVGAAVALSIAEWRGTAQQRIGMGPVGFLTDRAVGPVRQTLDAGNEGIIVRPGNQVFSTIPGMVVGNTSFNPNGADVKAAQGALQDFLRSIGIGNEPPQQPPQQLPQSNPPR